MTTSLARQLEQLKAASTAAPLSASAAAQPALLDEAGHLDATQLRLMAQEAWHTLQFEHHCPHLEWFTKKVFPDEDEEMANPTAPEHTWTDLLLLLSPYALHKSTQFLLEWLLREHRVHLREPEMFLFTLLPYHAYQLFQRAVHCVSAQHGPSSSSAGYAHYPKWFESFKQSCHPCTERGLLQHVAGDRGFFGLLCRGILACPAHHRRFPDANYDGLLHWFAATVLGALAICRAPAEHHVHGVLQVVTAGLKEPAHEEFRACGALLLAGVVPRVVLKEKVARQLLKVLGKQAKRNPDANVLALLLILYKSQRAELSAPKVLRALAGPLAVALGQVTGGAPGSIQDEEMWDREERDYLRMVLKTLAMLHEDSVEAESSEDLLQLLDFIHRGLSRQRPDVDTAISLLRHVSQALVKLDSQLGKKKVAKLGEEERELKSKMAAKCRQILSCLKPAFPEEFVRHSASQSEAVDIVFINDEEGGTTTPTDEQIEAKRVLLNNPLVQATTKEFLPAQSRDVQALIDTSVVKSVTDMFKSVEAAFLVRQLEAQSWVKLVTNLLQLCRKRTKLVEAVLNFICSKEFYGNEKIKAELDKNVVSIELLILPRLLVRNVKEIEMLVNTIKKSDYIKEHKSNWVCSIVNSISKSSEPDVIAQQNWAKLTKASGASKLHDYLKVVHTSTAHQNPSLVCILLLWASFEIRSKKSEAPLNLARAIVSLVKLVRTRLELLPEVENQEVLSADEAAPEILQSGSEDQVSLRILFTALESLRDVPPAQDSAFPHSVLAEACQWRKKKLKKIVNKRALDVFGKLFESKEKGENFAADVLCIQDGVSEEKDAEGKEVHQFANSAMKVHCINLLLGAIEDDAEALKRLVSFKSYVLPRALQMLASNDLELKLLTMQLLESVADKRAAAQTFMPMVKALVLEKEEILADSANIPRVMKAFFKEKSGAVLVRALLSAMSDMAGHMVFRHLTPFFRCVESRADMAAVAEFGHTLLDSNAPGTPETMVALLESFFKPIVSHIQDTKCWEFVEEVLASQKTARSNNLTRPIAAVALDIVREEVVLEKADDVEKLFSLLIDLSADCVISEVLLATKNVIGTLNLTGTAYERKIRDIWGDHMQKETTRAGAKGRKSGVAAAADGPQNEDKWKKTFFLLEMFASTKKCVPAGSSILLKPLFGVLKRSLQQDEYFDNAYGLDLILSSIHAIIEQLSPTELSKLESTSVNPELLVHCIRNCKNPDTKATALLILAKAASAACDAEYVLQNSIQIFTFVGSHFLKVDSRHSFESACQAIDIIIPHIQQVCRARGGDRELRETSLNIVTTFADASMDMTSQRFKTFLHKLMLVLGDREYLWIMTLLLLKAVGKKKSVGKDGAAPKSNNAERMRQIHDLYASFSAKTQLDSMLRMMVNLKKDSPIVRKMLRIKDKEETPGASDGEESKPLKPTDEFDLLRMKMLHFVSTLLNTKYFVRQIWGSLSADGGSGGDELRLSLQQLITCAILSLDSYEKTTKESKLHRHLVQQAEKVLEGSLAVLPAGVFVQVLYHHLSNPHEIVRKKSLEVLNAKLQDDDQIFTKEESLPELLVPLVCLAKGKVKLSDGTEQTEPEFNQQLAMLAVRSFGRHLGSKYPMQLKEACAQLASKSFLKGLASQNVRASALLCLTELFQSIGPHAVAYLPSFVNWLLGILDDVDELKSSTILLNSVILSAQKLMEHFSGFLHPYYAKLVVATCRIGQLQPDMSAQQSSNAQRIVSARVKHLQSAVAVGVPTHALLAICHKCFDDVRDEPDCVVALMAILQENLENLDKTQALAASGPFMDFFLHAFKYRETMYKQIKSSSELARVEKAVIDAFLALTLKLALDDFRPLFYRIFNLTFDVQNSSVHANATVFHVTREVAKKLKTLFDFLCEPLVQKASGLLDHFAGDEFALLRKVKREQHVLQLLTFVLEALTTAFTYNRVESVLTKNYEEHVNSILAYVNYPFKESNLESFFDKLTECLTQLAASTEDETQWKYLNYQVLLNLRNSSPKIRMWILGIVGQFVEKKGENYMAVLPEAVPFLSEVLEDDDYEIEVACKKLVARMEEVFGQSIESYFA